MMKSKIAITVSMLFLAGCAMNTKQPTPSPLTNDQLVKGLQQQQTELVNALSSICTQQQPALDNLQQEIKILQEKVDAVDRQTVPMVAPTPVACPEDSLGEKVILGEVEFVFIDELQAGFDTRIDTGAESSSLDARNIILFERDGQQWVRFDVNADGKDTPLKTFESKVERFVRIKGDESHSSGDRRPVISAHLQIGDYKAETSLNLNDRSGLEYPLLLGRKFMKDIAVVDVSQAYLHGKTLPSMSNNSN
ncbi:RimK/LysX family protein [Shewanella sp. NIFS-20-20]|uniref:putative ATP-dependent zinc protease n=1 Tax=Shewanella sp. NIFS-20-20 TaxID=2853806 RepID=UPI001C4468D4|nr:RimK/LysX family protein [Shewanella sp. NIFS-20-20]MBV7315713.1 RimK/LysX family protein [Shewanella sp. NIFS-20-20]